MEELARIDRSLKSSCLGATDVGTKQSAHYSVPVKAKENVQLHLSSYFVAGIFQASLVSFEIEPDGTIILANNIRAEP